MTSRALELVRTWLVLDFFGDSRHRGEAGSSLTSTIFTQSFLALILAAILFDSDSPTVAYATANLSLSTLMIAVAAFSSPARRDRTAADRVLVQTAPLPRALLPLARTLHASFFVVLVTTGMALPPAILMFWVGGSLWVVAAYLAVACALAGLLSGAITVAIRAVERFAGPIRAGLFAGTTKALMLGVGFVGFALCLPHLRGTVSDLPIPAAAVWSWPPYWAGRWLADPGDDLRLLGALVGAGIAVFALAVWLGDPERRASGRHRPRRSWLGRLERRLAGTGPLLGTTAFVSTMLGRSASFRARVLPLFGLPAAMLLLTFWEADGRERMLLLGMALQFPGIYIPFLVMFLPFGEGGSSWMFETSPRHSIGLCRRAAAIALSVRVLLPAQLAALALTAAFGFGLVPAIALCSFSWALAVGVTLLSVRTLRDVPFTLDADAETALEYGGMIGAAIILALLGAAMAMIADTAVGGVVGIGAAIVAYRALHRYGWGGTT